MPARRPQTDSASSAVGASTITRTRGSVPLGRNRTRPRPASLADSSSTALCTAAALWSASRSPALLAQVQGGQGDQLVAVHHRAVAIDGQDAVAVSVEGEAGVVAGRLHPRLDAIQVGRATVVVDVDAVGLVGEHAHVGAKAA